jgi:IstB-like ATP binding protein
MSDGIADASGSKPLPSRNDVHYVADSTGIGKSFVACALAQKACRDGYSALYTRAAALFRDLALARADGSLRGLCRGSAGSMCW